MKIHTFHKEVIWFDDVLIDELVVDQAFSSDYWYTRNKIIGSAQGRGTTWFIQTDKMTAALRHYHRGGLFGKLIKDHYWFSNWQNTRSCQEFQLLQYLIESGVNVPKPIAARATKKTMCYRADILTQKIDQAKDLVDILQDKSLPKETYQFIGQQVRKLHNANVNHTDLNIHNILVDADNKVWIIDFDKCYRKPASTEVNLSSWKKSNLDRLLRSFNKELSKRSIYWAEEDWQALLAGYNG